MRLVFLSAMISSLLLLQACTSWSPNTTRTRPAVNLGTVGVPELPSTPSPFGLSERGPSHATAATKHAELDLDLRPRSAATPIAAKHEVADKRVPPRERTPTATPAPASLPAPALQVSPEEQKQDETLYAQREQQAPALKEFRGGDAIVITMSTLVVVLLIVLLVVLIVD